MKLITDSREQRPYSFETETITQVLPTGDYSISGLEDHIAIERKELNDLVGCLRSGRVRFERELHRGKALDYFCLVVETSLQDTARHTYRSKMLPQAVIQSLIAFSIRYRLPVWFAGNRQYGQEITESLLLKYGREVEKKWTALGKGEISNCSEPLTKRNKMC